MTTSDWIAVGGIATTFLTATIGSVFIIVTKIVSKILHKIDDKFKEIDQTLMEIKIAIAQMQVKVDVLWQHHLSKSNSPVVLNEAGLKALEVSNVGKFVERYYEDILLGVKKSQPQNAYQAQELLISIVGQYKKIDECRMRLQEAAFSSGYDVDALLFVAALSIRDKVIADLGFGVTIQRSDDV